MTGTSARRIMLLCGAALFVLLWIGLGVDSRAASDEGPGKPAQWSEPARGFSEYDIGASVPLTTPTPIRTVSPTPTAVCPVGGGRYVVAEGTATIVPGTLDTGNHCDDCSTLITLPFSVRLYEGTFTQATLHSNGVMRLGNGPIVYRFSCGPVFGTEFAIYPFQEDLVTTGAGQGIFTSVTASAPNRVFNIEWRAGLFSGGGTANFEARFYENNPNFDIVYGNVPTSAGMVGVVRDERNFTWHWCTGGMPVPGARLSFTFQPCATGTPTSTSTPTPTRTPTPGVCVPGGRYRIIEATGTVVPGGGDTGNHCDDCYTPFVFPFPVRLYENTYTQAQIGSNGVLVFGTPPIQFTDVPCIPAPGATYTIFPFWNDLRTDTTGSGVYMAVLGFPPNRILTIEWRATLFGSGERVNFHVLFAEGSTGRFEITYGKVPAITQQVGVQRDKSNSSWYSCTGGGPNPGLRLIFTGEPCFTATPGATQIVSTFTPTPEATNTTTTTPPPTSIHSSTSTSTFITTSTATASTTPSAVCGGLAWRIAPTPPGENQTLRGVEMISPTDIWAVGSNGAKRWDGSRWHDMSSPLNDLHDVGALSPNDVWAVGTSGIVHWDGTAWSWSRTEWYENYTRVEVLGPNDVWAAGYAYIGPTVPWVMHWDGASWTDLEPPFVHFSNFVQGLSVRSSNDAWAVGYAGTSQDRFGVILHWNGTGWSQQEYRSGGLPRLYGVKALAPDDVWAVGEDFGQTLALHYDGIAWSQVGAPDIGLVMDIVALSATDIWAVGGGGVMNWNGHGWFRVDAPPMSLEGIDALTEVDVLWAVGTGVLHYSTALFADVPPNHTFYPFIQCLACWNVLSGYADGTFRPQNNITRGQLAKVVSNAAGFEEDPGPQIYEDVPMVNTFYASINRLSNRGYMSGYPCGGTGEPCGPGNRPYFRPQANVTRGQAAKIVSNAAGFIEPVSGQTYQDVPPSHTFYEFIERLTARNIMSGYACPGGGINPCTGLPESCQPPEQRPFFKPCLNVTRGQASKMVANTFFPECPAR